MADEATATTETPAGEAPAGGSDEATAEAEAASKTAEEAKATEADGNGEDKGEALIVYEPFAMPEGVQVDQEALKDFIPVAQKYKLPQEGAQELVNLLNARDKKRSEAHTKAWADAMGKWRNDAKADPDIGGENFTQTEVHVALALKKLGTPKLEEILKITGTGNHVEIVRFMSKVGKIIDSDTIDLGGALSETPKTQAEIMYPDQGK